MRSGAEANISANAGVRNGERNPDTDKTFILLRGRKSLFRRRLQKEAS